MSEDQTKIAQMLERKCIKLKSRVEIIKDAFALELPNIYIENLLDQLEAKIDELPASCNHSYKIFIEEFEKLTLKMMIKRSKEINKFYENVAEIPDRKKEKGDLFQKIFSAMKKDGL